MNTNPNKRPIAALAAAGVLAWALAGCSGSTNLVTPTLPPDGTTTPTSAQPTIAPPTAPPTQPVPDDETTTTVVNPDPEPDPDPAPEPDPEPDPDPGPQYRLWDIPQLGTDPVRGSGCGLDGSLGDTLPDGWWFGTTRAWTADSFEFNLACVYFGDSAQPQIDECLSGSDAGECDEGRSPSFWPVDRSQRLRSVPRSPDMALVVEGEPDCPWADPTQDGMISAIQVVDGSAVYLSTSCPGD